MLGGIEKYKKIHFTGIGGIGMSALAGLCLEHGKTVTGSDSHRSKITERLSAEGAELFDKESDKNISDSHDLLVYTPAVSEDHSELLEARKKNLPAISYPEALGLISKDMFTIAVSGTHGKTTTTAMIAHILESAGLDPTVVVGSLTKSDGNGDWASNFRYGKGGYFVVEACEYKRSFSHLYPDILIITNIEEDHLDYYKDLSDIQSAFKEIVLKLPEDGKLVCLPKDAKVKPVVSFSKALVVDYGKVKTDNLDLLTPGAHNRLNAQAAVAVAGIVGVSSEEAKDALGSFSGTWRRFEYKGKTKKGALVFDDYAHHPSEIVATISAAREKFADKEVVVVFQPHLYSRTDFFFDDFVGALSSADHVVLTPVYQARAEKHEPEHSAEHLVLRLSGMIDTASYVPSLELATDLVLDRFDSDCIVIMMGAGDIYTATKKLVLEKVR